MKRILTAAAVILAAYVMSPEVGAQTAPVQNGDPVTGFSSVDISPKWGVNIYSGKMLDISPRDFGRCTPDPAKPLVYCGGADGVFRALHRETGNEIWSMKTSGGVRAAPAISDHGLYLAAADGCLHRVEPETGVPIWPEPYCTDNSIWGSPLIVGDTVYFPVIGNQMYAVGALDGRFKFKVQRDKPQFMSSEGVSEPAVDGDVLFAAFSDGVLVAVNRFNGREIWQQDLAGGKDGPRDADATPVIADGVVYSGAFAAGPVAMKASDGSIIWKANRFGVGKPLVSGRTLIVADADGYVAALDRRSGREVWITKLDTSAAWNPVQIGDLILVGGDRGLWVLRLSDGAVLQIKLFPFGITAEPAVIENELFFVSPGGTINAATLRR